MKQIHYPFKSKKLNRGMSLLCDVSLGTDLAMLIGALLNLGMSHVLIDEALNKLNFEGLNALNFRVLLSEGCSTGGKVTYFKLLLPENVFKDTKKTISYSGVLKTIAALKLEPLDKARVLKVYSYYWQQKAELLGLNTQELELYQISFSEMVKDLSLLSILAYLWQILEPASVSYTVFALYDDLRKQSSILGQKCLAQNRAVLKDAADISEWPLEDRRAFEQIDRALAAAWLQTLAVQQRSKAAQTSIEVGLGGFFLPKNEDIFVSTEHAVVCKMSVEKVERLPTSSGFDAECRGYRVSASFNLFDCSAYLLRTYKEQLFSLGAEDFSYYRSFDRADQEMESLNFWVNAVELDVCKKYLFLDLQVDKIGISEEILHTLGYHEHSIQLGSPQKSVSVRIGEKMLQGKMIRRHLDAEDIRLASQKLAVSEDQCRVDAMSVYLKNIKQEGLK